MMRARLWLPLLAAACNGPGTVPGRAPEAATIAAVQGSADVSPFAGRRVVVTGIVSGDFQYGDADAAMDAGGYFLQSEHADPDPATSDGIFVTDGDRPVVDVSVGDRVTVEGSVTERDGETQILARAVSLAGRGRPLASDLSIAADLERYEGMLVRVRQPLYVQDLYDLERYGRVLLSLDRKVLQFTNGNRPDREAYAAWQQRNAARSLVLDDGASAEYPRAPRYLYPDPARPGLPLRIGDSVSGLLGVLRPNGRPQDGWRLLPVAAPRFTAGEVQLAAPGTGGAITVASFNVLNYFSTLDDGTNACGPRHDTACRGANSAAELARQRAKTITTLGMLGADIVGLIEIENNANAAIASIVNGLNEAATDAGWDWIDTGSIGSGAIRVALIYRRGRVQPVGKHAVLDDTLDERFDARRNRPALAQSFRDGATGGVFTVVVNHLKSKGSSCADDGDPDTGDGQGNCNRTRTAAARALADWLARDPTGSNDADTLIIGDLNSHLREDPLRALEDAGYVNLLRRDIGDDAWSFVYRGAAGALDHALASPTLAAQVSGVAEWHINAAAPAILDYNLDNGRDPGLFDPASPWRTSDHDPLLIGLAPDPD